jgi:hypothetical protein
MAILVDELASLDAVVALDDMLVAVVLGMAPTWSRFGAAVGRLCHRATMDVSRCSCHVFVCSSSLLSYLLLLLALGTGPVPLVHHYRPLAML